MNKICLDILLSLTREAFVNQRVLSERCGYSLGIVNNSIKILRKEGWLNSCMELTEKARSLISERAPKRAIILAAGFGLRMIPINTETPKALLDVKGVPLIERVIGQLHEVGVTEIYIVVGYAKERFEYLIDSFDVKLIVNTEYATRNNLHSLWLAKEHLDNCYVVPCDLWCSENPFREAELYAWYMVSDAEDIGSSVRVNRKQELVTVKPENPGNRMVGISYLTGEQANIVHDRLCTMDKIRRYDGSFWEETLFIGEKMILESRVVPAGAVVEINTYEQLRELDSGSSQLKAEAIETIALALNVNESEIYNITVQKKGMTNRSFSFVCRGKKYMMRIPGEGTDRLINRKNEASVYEAINSYDICDCIRHIDPNTGYKISEYLEDARPCDPSDPVDVQKCMKKLRDFHQLGLKVGHVFDIFERIGFYESLWGEIPSVYKDYRQTKQNVLSLRGYIDAQEKLYCLTHIDAVPDNFLFTRNDNGEEEIRLIDWEYAGMQDPHVDLAMFCIYAMYDREQVDALIDAYFTEGCTHALRVKIYCYIAACGLVWSNWCEYKRNLGVEFGEYSLRQYRYAKEYFRIVQNETKAV